jgi:hypothetical protein
LKSWQNGSIRTEVFWKNIEKMHFSLKNLIEKLMVPSESTPQERSDECFDNLNFLGQFLCPARGNRSHQSVLHYGELHCIICDHHIELGIKSQNKLLRLQNNAPYAIKLHLK